MPLFRHLLFVHWGLPTNVPASACGRREGPLFLPCLGSKLLTQRTSLHALTAISCSSVLLPDLICCFCIVYCIKANFDTVNTHEMNYWIHQSEPIMCAADISLAMNTC